MKSKLGSFKVSVGRYVDISDSFHIYGSYHMEFTNFLKMVKGRSFEEGNFLVEDGKVADA